LPTTDRIGNVGARSQTAGTLPVQRIHGGFNGESSDQASGPALGSTTTGGEHGSHGNVFNNSRVDSRALDEPLEDTN